MADFLNLQGKLEPPNNPKITLAAYRKRESFYIGKHSKLKDGNKMFFKICPLGEPGVKVIHIQKLFKNFTLEYSLA